MRKIFLLLYLILSNFELNGQTRLDSLWNIWQDTTLIDTTRAIALEDYIYGDYFFTNPNSAITLANQLLTFSEGVDYKKGVVNSLELLGYLFFRTGDNSKSLEHYQRGLKLAQAIGYKKGIANILVNTGYIFHDNGELITALSYYQKSLKSYEAINDEEGMAAVYNEFGSIYREQQEYEKSLSYYSKAMTIYEELKIQNDHPHLFLNLGSLYVNQKEYLKAFDNFQKGLVLYEKDEDQLGIASGLAGIGSIYIEQGDYNKALDYLQKSLTISRQVDDIQGVSQCLLSIGDIYADQKNYTSAIKNCKKSLALAKNLGNIDDQEDACYCLYYSYKALGQVKEALTHLELMVDFSDSLQTEETVKKLQRMEFAKQTLADSLIQVKKDTEVKIAHQVEVQRKDKIRNLAIGVGLIFLVLAGGFYNRWKYVKKSRALLQKEKNRSENLLLNILPAEVAEELKEKGEADVRDFDLVSILFTDFKGYTEKSEKVSAKKLIGEINHCFKAFDFICEKYGVEKIKTIGDAYMAAGGLPTPSDNSVQNTVLAALEMQTFITERMLIQEPKNEITFEMRLGIHTGPVAAGIVGVKKFQYDVWGNTVNTASRMESHGEVGKVNISQDTYELIKDKSQFRFEARGKIQVKGKGEVEMWYVYKSVPSTAIR